MLEILKLKFLLLLLYYFFNFWPLVQEQLRTLEVGLFVLSMGEMAFKPTWLLEIKKGTMLNAAELFPYDLCGALTPP